MNAKDEVQNARHVINKYLDMASEELNAKVSLGNITYSEDSEGLTNFNGKISFEKEGKSEMQIQLQTIIHNLIEEGHISKDDVREDNVYSSREHNYDFIELVGWKRKSYKKPLIYKDQKGKCYKTDGRVLGKVLGLTDEKMKDISPFMFMY